MHLVKINPLKALLLSLAMSFATVAGAAEGVNINTADAPTLATALSGIGLAKAQAIVAYREANGPFKSVEQLADVKGVGLKTIEKNRAQMTVGGNTQKAPSPTPAAK